MKKMLLLVAAVLMLSGSSHAATKDTERLMIDNCQITRVTHVNSRVTATGRCVSSGKPIAHTWSYSYRLYDKYAYGCGTAPSRGVGSSFSIPAVGANALSYTFQVRSKYKVRGKYIKKSFTKRVLLGGDDAECGKLGRETLPSPASLCEWTPPAGPVPFDKCGKPNQMVSWSSPLTMNNNIVTLGRVASRSGYCYRTQGKIGTFPASRPRTPEWMKTDLVGENLRCADGVFAWINPITIGLTNLAGQSCASTPFGGTWSFSIPPNWGGKLHIAVSVGVGYDFRTGNPHPVALEQASATFSLRGGDDGCPELIKRN